ncbi:hypothetical protein [Sessilibacter sp. MAH4]
MIFPLLKFRKQKEPCIARGPSIKQAARFHGDYQGSTFSIKAPFSNQAGYEPDLSPMGTSYEIRHNKPEYSNHRWAKKTYINRRYDFWGPWGVGDVSSMRFSAGCINIREPKKGLSLFHPRAFEWAVLDFIQDRFINFPPETYESIPFTTVSGPIHWQPYDHLSGPTAYFLLETGHFSFENHYFWTTLDDSEIFFIDFALRPERSDQKDIPPEKWIDQRNMKQLMFDIFKSFTLELSPEANARRLKAIEGLTDASLKTTMEAHNFYIHPEKVKAYNEYQAQKKLAQKS